jgi:hypothetical protein
MTGYNVFTGLSEESFKVLSDTSRDIKRDKELSMSPTFKVSEVKKGFSVTDAATESPASDTRGSSEVPGIIEQTESETTDEGSQGDIQSAVKDSNKGQMMETELP